MSTLAIRGGPPAIPAGRPLFRAWPVTDDDSREAVLRVLDRGIEVWGSNAPESAALAQEWADYIGAPYCLVTNSGTAAIHMAVRGVGVQAGDEVILPAYCYGAAPAAVLHQCAVPVFADIDRETFMLDPARVEERITPRTRAIMPVHLFGLPADMDPLMALAKKHHLGVASDAAQAAGAEYQGRQAGSIEDAAGFSLNPVKNLPGIEGGLFVARRPDIFENGSMASQNIQLVETTRQYPVYSLGYNYRPNEISSAFARDQLPRLDQHNAMRIANCERLSHRLQALAGVHPPYVPPDRKHVYHIYRVRLEAQEAGFDLPDAEFRNQVRAALEAEGAPCTQWIDAQAGPLYPLLQLQEGFGNGWPWKWHPAPVEYRMEAFPEAQRFLDTTVELSRVPLAMGPGVIDLIADAFTKVWENLNDAVGRQG